MSAIPTVSEVREAGQFVLLSDGFIAQAITDAAEDVDMLIERRRELDPALTISDNLRRRLIQLKACDICVLSERRLQSESGAGLSATYQDTEGSFRRAFSKVWAQACGGITALDKGYV